jgi:hypothetical protein
MPVMNSHSFRKIMFVFCAALSFGASIARAELISAADPRFGLNSLTIDTRTGLGWLDLTLSTGFSWLQAEAAIPSGGIFEGYRHATADEVLSLYQSTGISTGSVLQSSPMAASLLSLMSLIGITSYQDGHPQTFGITASGSSGLGRAVAGFDFLYGNSTPEYLVTGGSYIVLRYGETTAVPEVGNWLVKVVPEPSPALIGLVALLLFGMVWRKRQVTLAETPALTGAIAPDKSAGRSSRLED